MVLVYRVPLLNPFRRRRRRRRFRERERERKCSTRRQFAKKWETRFRKGAFFFPPPEWRRRERERERERDAPYFLRPRPGLRRDELFQVSDGIVLVALHAYFLPEAVVEDHFDHDDHDHDHHHHHDDVSTKRVVSTIEASSSFTSSSSFCPSQSLLLLLSENE